MGVNGGGLNYKYIKNHDSVVKFPQDVTHYIIKRDTVRGYVGSVEESSPEKKTNIMFHLFFYILRTMIVVKL